MPPLRTNRLSSLWIIAALLAAGAAPRPSLPAGPGPQAPAVNILAQPGQAYLHFSTSLNIFKNATFLDNPALNNRITTRFLVTAQETPYDSGPLPGSHPQGVYYDSPQHLWSIYNDDSASMSNQLSWNVFIPPQDGTLIAHVSLAGNTVGPTTFISDPQLNGAPGAVVFVEHVFNAITSASAAEAAAPDALQGGSGTFFTHTVSVIYDNGRSQWGIRNNDGSPFPPNINFFVLKASDDETAFKQVVTPANRVSTTGTVLDNPALNGNPDALMLVTENYGTGVVNNHQVAVSYAPTAQRWYIHNLDGSLPAGATLNVLVIPPKTGYFVHEATLGNTTLNMTALDNPALNNNPDALIYVMHNWNPPGDENLIYNDHPIGVRYLGGGWYILNTDGAPMPEGITFNVYYTWPRGNSFSHSVSASNTTGHVSNLNNPLLFDNTNIFPVLTANLSPGGLDGSTYTPTVGLKYDAPQSTWDIFNDLGPDFVLTQTYNVLAGESQTSFQATSVTPSGDYFYIDNPLTNNNPSALVFASPHDNSGINAENVGVFYDTDPGRWAIYIESRDEMPVGPSFNVFVVGMRGYLPVTRK